MKTKTFIARTVAINHADNDHIGGSERNRHHQGDIFLMAKNKQEAMEKLEKHGYGSIRATNLKASNMGNDLTALLDQGVLDEDSVLIGSDNYPYHIARISITDSGDRVIEAIGTIESNGAGGSVFKPGA